MEGQRQKGRSSLSELGSKRGKVCHFVSKSYLRKRYRGCSQRLREGSDQLTIVLLYNNVVAWLEELLAGLCNALAREALGDIRKR